MAAINSKKLLERFEAHLVESALAPATVVNYVADLRAFLRWSEETSRAEHSPFDLGVEDIQAYRSFLQSTKNHAPATINRRLQALRKFYTFAQSEGWTRTNPAEGVGLLSESASRRSRQLSGEDIARLLEAVRRGRPRWVARDWAVFQVFLGAGLKLGELTALRLSDVHLDHSQPFLEVRNAFDGSSRVIALEDEACEALRVYLSARRAAPGVDHVFVNRDGNPFSTRSVQRLLRHYARQAGLEGLTTQALRYAYARRIYERSGDLDTVTQLLGHRHAATTIRYLRPSPTQGQENPTDNSES